MTPLDTTPQSPTQPKTTRHPQRPTAQRHKTPPRRPRSTPIPRAQRIGQIATTRDRAPAISFQKSERTRPRPPLQNENPRYAFGKNVPPPCCGSPREYSASLTQQSATSVCVLRITKERQRQGRLNACRGRLLGNARLAFQEVFPPHVHNAGSFPSMCSKYCCYPSTIFKNTREQLRLSQLNNIKWSSTNRTRENFQ